MLRVGIQLFGRRLFEDLFGPSPGEHRVEVGGKFYLSEANLEALDRLAEQKVPLNYCRVRAFPFSDAVREFIEQHDVVYVVEQNRDAQLRTLLMLDSQADPAKLVPVLHYDGFPISSGYITRCLQEAMREESVA